MPSSVALFLPPAASTKAGNPGTHSLDKRREPAESKAFFHINEHPHLPNTNTFSCIMEHRRLLLASCNASDICTSKLKYSSIILEHIPDGLKPLDISLLYEFALVFLEQYTVSMCCPPVETLMDANDVDEKSF
ncbi:hypothetical protein BDP27DRAFT_1451708 [Rhodocollybia butyracea]|uniref:Uncharacterized protein n=1 Tax=Rhodocollybia butyracea TaxID=206335 RepID=A0A9P5PH25_9AGAR|nr:hypothetical protein BDP27DRAFT_1451708 [Rhodocollybia butyracea]